VEFNDFPGYLACLTKKANMIVGVQIQKATVGVQGIRVNSAKVEGLTVISQYSIPPSRNEHCLLVLQEDGSLLRYDVTNKEAPEASETKSPVSSLSSSSSSTSSKEDSSATATENLRKSGEALMNIIANRLGVRSTMITVPRKRVKKGVPKAPPPATATAIKSSSNAKPKFPVDFFEKAECITPSITLAGDVLESYTSEVAKGRLAMNDEYIVSLHTDSFTIVIQNNNPDLVMVGVRVLVGNASLLHIPTTLKVFDRVIELNEGMRRWYDIPFTVSLSPLRY